jgi:hypothetical protein
MNLAAVREQIKPWGSSSSQSGETDSIFQPLHSSHFADEQAYQIKFAKKKKANWSVGAEASYMTNYFQNRVS